MEQQMRWVALWSEQGQTKTLTFSSTRSRGIAQIDFKLILVSQGKRIPACYELGEAGDSLHSQTHAVWQDSQETVRLPRLPILGRRLV
jgi:hypothetical protein